MEPLDFSSERPGQAALAPALLVLLEKDVEAFPDLVTGDLLHRRAAFLEERPVEATDVVAETLAESRQILFVTRRQIEQQARRLFDLRRRRGMFDQGLGLADLVEVDEVDLRHLPQMARHLRRDLLFVAAAREGMKVVAALRAHRTDRPPWPHRASEGH